MGAQGRFERGEDEKRLVKIDVFDDNTAPLNRHLLLVRQNLDHLTVAKFVAHKQWIKMGE